MKNQLPCSEWPFQWGLISHRQEMMSSTMNTQKQLKDDYKKPGLPN